MGSRGPSITTGTRFRLFPQLPFRFPERPPETVCISTQAGRVGPGPADDRVYLINPVGKRRPYGLGVSPYGMPLLELPPWHGRIRRPIEPGAGGHFDHIPVGAPEFAEAHVFGAIRFTMDVWERYFGSPVRWHFGRDFGRLEAVMLPDFDNAHVGYGFMEVGEHRDPDGARVPFALNFDVIAHELGHLLAYGIIGVPWLGAGSGEYFGFQETAADMTAIVAALHFETMLDDLLEETRGNLYSFNELNRFAELSATRQIRLASNSVTMSEFAAGWGDEHDLSQPLTGALFDILVDVFQEKLVERGLISRRVADLSDLVAEHPAYEPVIQTEFDAAYPGQGAGFRAALIEARDYLGTALAETWKRLSADYLDYEQVARLLLAVDGALTAGRYAEEMAESFAWRGIGAVRAGPRLAPAGGRSHTCSVRTVTPADVGRLPKLSYRERMQLARGW